MSTAGSARRIDGASAACHCARFETGAFRGTIGCVKRGRSMVKVGLPRLHVHRAFGTPRRRARAKRDVLAASQAKAAMNAPDANVAATAALFPPAMPALLALADGTMFRGTCDRRIRHDSRRSRLQHRDDGLSGNPHGSVVRRPDRHADLPAHRQRRRQCRRRRVEAHLCCGTRDPRLAAPRVELAIAAGPRDVSAQRQHRRHCRYRHAQADPHSARARGAERVHRRGPGHR